MNKTVAILITSIACVSTVSASLIDPRELIKKITTVEKLAQELNEQSNGGKTEQELEDQIRALHTQGEQLARELTAQQIQADCIIKMITAASMQNKSAYTEFMALSNELLDKLQKPNVDDYVPEIKALEKKSKQAQGFESGIALHVIVPSSQSMDITTGEYVASTRIVSLYMQLKMQQAQEHLSAAIEQAASQK
ncbi:MAG: hypothetical protein WCE21_05255 [Candidatus Babeliales bacterium]